MTAALADDATSDLTAPDNVATARRVAAMHFADATRPGRCFRCHAPHECPPARWAAGILALAGAATQT